MDNLLNSCVPPPCGGSQYTLMSPRMNNAEVKKQKRTTGLTLSEWKQASQEDFLQSVKSDVKRLQDREEMLKRVMKGDEVFPRPRKEEVVKFYN